MWQGEPEIAEFLGIRGIKCILKRNFDLENRVRALEGKAPITWTTAINKMKTLMDTYKTEDEGVDVV